jgi:hypothetical protein
MATCNPEQLLTDAAGLQGLSEKQLQASKTASLCGIANNPLGSTIRITEAGDTRFTEDGNTRVIN